VQALSPQTLSVIGLRWMLGATVPALARDYGLTHRQVRRIVTAERKQVRP
jgi:hypothetical protein